MLLPESTHALAVGILLVVLFISFVREWVKPDVAVLTAVALLLLTGLLTPAKVLGVFSNSAPFTIACLFIISGALSRTGCVDWLGERIAQAWAARSRWWGLPPTSWWTGWRATWGWRRSACSRSPRQGC